MSKIDLTDMLKIWGCESSLRIIKERYELDLTYNNLNQDERETSILQVLKVLDSDLVHAGPHRVKDWELGWGKNLENFKATNKEEASWPGYFEKSKIIRWKQSWIKPNDSRLEQKLLAVLVDSLLLKFANNTDLSIYEFGCGTGHHLFRIRSLFPEKKLIGLDWAKSSQEIIFSYANSRGDDNLFGLNFDFFNPDLNLEIDKSSLFLTVASLEQTYEDFTKFVDFILDVKPRIVLNIEPMEEFLNPDNLMDFLSLKYFSKRKYLKKYFLYLTELERQGKIVIHDARRSYLGSFFIDGYSIVAWSPVDGS